MRNRTTILILGTAQFMTALNSTVTNASIPKWWLALGKSVHGREDPANRLT